MQQVAKDDGNHHAVGRASENTHGSSTRWFHRYWGLGKGNWVGFMIAVTGKTEEALQFQ